jgi:hypothetical protein
MLSAFYAFCYKMMKIILMEMVVWIFYVRKSGLQNISNVFKIVQLIREEP